MEIGKGNEEDWVGVALERRMLSEGKIVLTLVVRTSIVGAFMLILVTVALRKLGWPYYFLRVGSNLSRNSAESTEAKLRVE